MTDYEELVTLFANLSVIRGQFTLASGRTSNFYIDARIATMSPEGQALIGPIVINAIKASNWKVDAIGGLTLGADPIACSVSHASNLFPPLLRAFTVRKEPKTHGTNKLIEGPFRPGDRVLIIEDVITTGASALKAIEAVKREGGLVIGVLALLDREADGIGNLEAAGYNVITLIRMRDLIRAASFASAVHDFALVQSSPDKLPLV